MTALTWEDPPAPSEKAPRLAEVVAALRARPGVWAVVARPDRAARASLTADAYRREDGLEVRLVKVGPEHRVYARAAGGPLVLRPTSGGWGGKCQHPACLSTVVWSSDREQAEREAASHNASHA